MRYFWMAIFLTLPLIGEEILVRSPTGDSLTIEIDPELSFAEAIAKMEASIDHLTGIHVAQKNFLVDFMLDSSATKTVSSPRNYAQTVSIKEKEDIRYIVVTLATNSWLQLLGAKSSLKRAGDRIDHIHPLRFIMCIFTDEELKGSVHSIRDRSKIWSEFFDGLAKSLEEEFRRNNLRADQIEDLARILNIDPNLITASLQQRKWEQTLDQLLVYLPRTGAPAERYNQ